MAKIFIEPIEQKHIQRVFQAKEEAKREDSRNYLGFSGIGDECMRKVWYDFRGYDGTVIPGRVKMIFDLGHKIEELSCHYLRLAGYKLEHAWPDEQMSFSAINGLFRGHPDGVIHGVTAKPHMLEIKSANKNRFEQFKKKGFAHDQKYHAQIQLCMMYAGLERGFVFIYCKDNCDIHIERMYYDEKIALHFYDVAGTIIASPHPPERGHKETDIKCNWCHHNMRCWSNMGIQKRKTCGTCQHLKSGIQMKCDKKKVDIVKWGLSCEEWKLNDC